MKKFFLFLFFVPFLAGCKPSNSKNGSSMNDSTIVAVIKTNMGTFECQLFPGVAPKAVENFVGLANSGYYDSLTFHRVIDNFMIQGGDPNGNGTGGHSIWGGYFDDEFNEHITFDSAGVMAMANKGPNTNGSQFFITLAKTPWLNYHFTIFGKVIEGMDVVKKIGKVPVTKPYDKPVNPVIMEKVTIKHLPKQN